MHGGDDLEDDYVPDSNLVIVSDEEDEEEEDMFNEFAEINDGSADVTRSTQIENNSISKKRKRRDKEKAKKAKKQKLAVEPRDVQPLIACLPPADAATYLCAQQAKAFSKLSILELEDRRIPVSCIADTTTYSGTRTLDDFGNFIRHSFPQLMLRLSQKPRNNGAPTLIFMAGAALRVADVTRMLKKYRGDKGGEIAKLFAKHIKLQDHITYLRQTKIGVAVGTPARLGQLLDAEALVLTALTHICIDTSFRDTKRRSMLDIPETREETFRSVLGNDRVRAVLDSGKVQLILF